MVTRVVPDGKKKVLIPTNTNNCKNLATANTSNVKILATDFNGLTRIGRFNE
jgi:hypothetical protein